MHQVLQMPTQSTSLLENLAELHSKNQRYDQAIQLYSLVLQKCQSSSQTDQSQIERLFLCISQQYIAEENYNEALEYYLKVLHSKIIHAQYNLNEIMQLSQEIIQVSNQIKDYKKRIYYLDQALLYLSGNIAVEAFAKIAEQIGVLYHLQNDRTNAIKYYEKAIEAIKSSETILNFDLTEYYVRLGMAYLEKKFFEKALNSFQEALKILLIIPKEENYALIEKITEKIGSIYVIQEEFMNALSQYRTCLETKMKRLGLCHRELVPIIDIIGGIYYQQGNYIDALRYYKQSYRMVMKTGNSEDPRLVTIYINMASIYKLNNKHQKALKNYSKALKIVKASKSLEKEKEKRVQLYREIGELFHKMENYAESVKFLVKVIQADEEDSTSKNLEFYVKVANLYELLGKYKKAQQYLMKLFVLQKKLLGGNHLCTQATLWRLENLNQRVLKEVY